MHHLLGREPHTLGEARSRWTLRLLRTHCPWLADTSLSGVWRILDRLGLHDQRARHWVHSPDPAYAAKLTAVTHCRQAAGAAPGRVVTLYQDEVTIERQPTVAPAYARTGAQPCARRSHQANPLTRLTAALDPAAGRVVAMRASQITVATLVACYQDLVAAYPEAERLYLIQDTWPVHCHPDLLVALDPQETPFPLHCPPSWPAEAHDRARRGWGDLHLPIQLVPLPTDASWCNPIEKLWRWLKQDVTHLHCWANDLPTLRQHLDHFLAQFSDGSHDLLRYTGLLVPD